MYAQVLISTKNFGADSSRMLHFDFGTLFDTSSFSVQLNENLLFKLYRR